MSAPPGGQLNASRTPIVSFTLSLLNVFAHCGIQRVTQLQGEREHHTLFANTWVVLCSVLKSPAPPPPPPYDCLHVWRGKSYPQHQCGGCEAEGCVQGLSLGEVTRTAADRCREENGRFSPNHFLFFCIIIILILTCSCLQSHLILNHVN